jgi:hypothetical protein
MRDITSYFLSAFFSAGAPVLGLEYAISFKICSNMRSRKDKKHTPLRGAPEYVFLDLPAPAYPAYIILIKPLTQRKRL